MRSGVDGALAKVLYPRIGFVPGAWPRRLYRLLEQSAARAGATPEAYLRELVRSPEPGALDDLVDAAMVGHTRFFRHHEQFTHLQQELVSLGRKRRVPVSIWCAGCSTGEEAYSLALCSREVGVSTRILATDVNPKAIATARRGRFKASRPGTLPSDATRWEAPSDVRDRLEFVVASLASGSPSGGRGPFDIVLCRNVLIYFRRDQVPAILNRLADQLRPNGLLLVAPADAVLPMPPRLVPSGEIGAFRVEHDQKASAPTPPTPQATKGVALAPRRLQPTPASHDEAAPTDPLEEAVRLLGAGDADGAEHLLGEIINAAPDNIAAWFILGEALSARGERSQAQAAFDRVLRCSARDDLAVDADALRWAASLRLQR